MGGRGHQRHLRPAARPAARGREALGPRRPIPGALARLGPPAGAGRWSLVVPLLEPAPSPTETAHAIALQLLERHGVVTREAVKAEGTPGGFAGVYPVLRALEESGRARARLVRRRARRRAVRAAGRGRPAARAPHDARPTSRRASSCSRRPIPRSPTAPRSAWPERDGRSRPTRTAGAHVVLVDGVCVVYIERGGRSLLTFRVRRRRASPTRGSTHWSRRTRKGASVACRSNASTTSPHARHRTRRAYVPRASPTATRV